MGATGATVNGKVNGTKLSPVPVTAVVLVISMSAVPSSVIVTDHSGWATVVATDPNGNTVMLGAGPGEGFELDRDHRPVDVAGEVAGHIHRGRGGYLLVKHRHTSSAALDHMDL